MLSKRSRIILSAIGTFLCLLSVVYVSCTKVGPPPSCNGVVCLNNGYCNHGRCVCPVGYEGTNCGTASVDKFIGNWDVKQVVIGSDNPPTKGITTNYSILFKHTATPTTFFIFNFLNDPSYNELVCVLDSVNTNNFYLDTMRGFNMYFDHIVIKENSRGSYNNATRDINATFILRHLNATHNWQIDTMSLYLKPHF